MIDVKVVNKNESEIDYPKFMISIYGVVVYFVETGSGRYISGDDKFNMFDYSSRWDMDKFKDFHGDVVMKNKVKS